MAYARSSCQNTTTGSVPTLVVSCPVFCSSASDPAGVRVRSPTARRVTVPKPDRSGPAGRLAPMARLKFRDRIYNRKVAHAMTSPLGIVLAGSGVAVGLALGLPIVVAAGLGAAAWAARVAVAMPRGIDFDGIDPFELADPWRTYVWNAKRAKRLYADAVKSAREGPVRERLDDLGNHIAEGVWEVYRIAQSGQLLTQARARINDRAIAQQPPQLNWKNGGPPTAGSSKAQTVAALESQLETAKRLDAVIADTSDKLQLLNSRLDEAVTRAVELAARGQQVDDLGSVVNDVNAAVSDMEALRLALDETDR